MSVVLSSREVEQLTAVVVRRVAGVLEWKDAIRFLGSVLALGHSVALLAEQVLEPQRVVDRPGG